MIVEIVVDDKKISVDDSGNLIDELKKHNIEIPHFCYHKALGVSGNCRMCLIEVVGQKRPQIACDTPISAGMEIKINSELTRKVQRLNLALEFKNHPLDCPICDQAGECRLQEYYMKFDLSGSDVDKNWKVDKPKKQDFGSGIVHDASRCVLCRRCVRFLQNCTKTCELGLKGRGEWSEISIFGDRKIDNDYAGNVADLCPVGAMTLKDFRFKQRVWNLDKQEAICQKCSKGCNIQIWSYTDKNTPRQIYRFTSNGDDFICDEGRYSYKNEPFLKSDIASGFSFQGCDLIVTSTLSLEEMSAVKSFASKVGLRVFGYSEFDDENFKENTNLKLRQKDKSSNKKGLEKLEFNQNLNDLKDDIVIFHLGDLENLKTKFASKNVKFIAPREGADIVCASAYHRSGHTINCDNEIKFSKANFNDKTSLSIIEILEKFIGENLQIQKDFKCLL